MNKWNNTRYKIISSLIPQCQTGVGKKAIDIGCCEGTFTAMLCEKAYETFGIDINEEKIEIAKNRWSNTKSKFEIQDATKLRFADESFDIALCLEVIEHLNDPNKLLIEIRRVLKPEGLLVISTPNRFSLEGLGGRILGWIRGKKWDAWDQTHQRVFSSSEFLNLLRENGFEPIKLVGYYYFPSVHYFGSAHFLNRLQEMFDFARYAYSTRPFMRRVGFDTICQCVLRNNNKQQCWASEES